MADEDGRHLPIRTVYRLGRETRKINAAGSGTTAVPRAVMHMRSNLYEASVAEVYNHDTGKLHAVLRRSVTGKVTILYETKYHEGE